MPCEKKKQSQRINTSNSRRLLQTLAIKDLPHSKVYCVPDSLSPSPGTSYQCICQPKNCTCGIPVTYQSGVRPSPDSEQQAQKTYAPKYKRLDADSINSFPSCRELFWRLKQHAALCHPDDKRLNTSEADNNVKEFSNYFPTKPGHACVPECSMLNGPPVPKKDAGCAIQDWKHLGISLKSTSISGTLLKPTPQTEPVVKKREECSLESCARDTASKENNSIKTESNDTLHDKEITPQLQPMPTGSPAPSGKLSRSSNIAQKLSGIFNAKNIKTPPIPDCFCEDGSKENSKKTKKKDMEKDEKNDNKSSTPDCICEDGSKENGKNNDSMKDMRKEEKKASSKKYEKKVTASCNNPHCCVNTCTCHFPPAYSQYFECTGRISGNCNCDRN